MSSAERTVTRRDAGALYAALDASYLSPAAGFDELAATYDQRLAGNPVLLLESAETLAALPDLHGKRALDVGCGTGRYALQMARLGADTVMGIDLSPAMLDVAARKAERGDLADALIWKRGDVSEALATEAGGTDVLVCALTLSFLPGVRAAFAEMARALAPAGTLVVSDYHPHGLAQARAAASGASGNRERFPFLRFTSAGGEECRIAQYVHTISDYFFAARAAGLTLDHLAEPVADPRLAATYHGFAVPTGVPLAVVARFVKT